MPAPDATPSARRSQLVEEAYRYVQEHGLAELSLRPLAAAIGSSPRVLLFLFGSKEGLIRAVLDRARADETRGLETARSTTGLREAATAVWEWLSSERHRPVLRLWAEVYAGSVRDPHGPWGRFAADSVADWLGILAEAQTPTERADHRGESLRTLVLAVLRGALLDLLATGDAERTTEAVRRFLAAAVPPVPPQPASTDRDPIRTTAATAASTATAIP